MYALDRLEELEERLRSELEDPVIFVLDKAVPLARRIGWAFGRRFRSEDKLVLLGASRQGALIRLRSVLGGADRERLRNPLVKRVFVTEIPASTIMEILEKEREGEVMA